MRSDNHNGRTFIDECRDLGNRTSMTVEHQVNQGTVTSVSMPTSRRIYRKSISMPGRTGTKGAQCHVQNRSRLRTPVSGDSAGRLEGSWEVEILGSWETDRRRKGTKEDGRGMMEKDGGQRTDIRSQRSEGIAK
jgi:hypothetical protein